MSRLKTDVERFTQLYWEISSAYHRRVKTDVTVESALKSTGQILNSLGRHRRVVHSVAYLRDAIIQGPPKKRKATAQPNKILPLAKETVRV